jgi:hypothetical protein
MEITFDAATGRLLVALRVGATGPGFADAMIRLYRERPELSYVDKLYDLTEYEGVVTHADLTRVIEAYNKANPNPRHPCRTAFVTPDPNFGLWAAAMSQLFVGRDHRAFADFESAEAFLSEPLNIRRPVDAS